MKWSPWWLCQRLDSSYLLSLTTQLQVSITSTSYCRLIWNLLFSSWIVLFCPFLCTKYACQGKKSLVIQDVPVSVSGCELTFWWTKREKVIKEAGKKEKSVFCLSVFYPIIRNRFPQRNKAVRQSKWGSFMEIIPVFIIFS